MFTPTKILKYDLAFELQDLLSELEEINDDLKQANIESGKKVSERLQEIEARIRTININQLETGNFSETFTYDEDGNVIKHEVTGENPSITTYMYKNDGSGELESSTKVFTNSDNQTITITKIYTYTDGNITGIQTTTEITPVN